MKGSTFDLRTLAAHHEAGHAVAAVMRGGSRLKSVTIDETVHGDGLTVHTSAPWDRSFIAWAGPWAEARLRWGDRPLDAEDDDCQTFDDYVLGQLVTHRSDAEQVRGGNASMATIDVWFMEMEHVRVAVAEVAAALLLGSTVTHDDVETLVERAWAA